MLRPFLLHAKRLSQKIEALPFNFDYTLPVKTGGVLFFDASQI